MAPSSIASSTSTLHILPQLQQRQSTLFSQLASGNRLVSAAVDAAGLGVAQELTAQVNGLGQAQDNADTANNLFQTAGSAVSSQENALQQERQLGLQAANGTLTDSDRQAVQAQVDQLQQGINNVANQTDFNTKPLLNGQQAAPAGLTFQVGANANQTVQGSLNATTTQQLGVANLDVTTQAGAQNAIGQLDQGIQTASAEQGSIGAMENRLTNASANAGEAQMNAEAARSRIADTNMADASSNLANALLVQRFSLFALQQQAHTFALQNTLLAG